MANRLQQQQKQANLARSVESLAFRGLGAEWVGVCTNIDDAVAWNAAGFTPAETRHWRSTMAQYIQKMQWIPDAAECAAWREDGFSASHMSQYICRGLGLINVNRILRGG